MDQAPKLPGRRNAGYFLLVLALLLLSVSACEGMGLNTLSQEAPTASPTPQVIIQIATPTPISLPADANALEAQRIAVYQRVAPAVVNITTQVMRTSFFWELYPEEGSGSGFVWDEQGHIVTNYHVVEGARSIEVSFGQDTTVPATVVGMDPLNDLAVIAVDSIPEGVTPLEPGESANLQVGQTAIAIGNPFGQFDRTMTEGIISALNRTIETDSNVLRGAIQTDAAINRGNSGGPLLDSRGRLIGVNTAIFSPTGTSAGVGLAIPVDTVRRVVPVLIEQGRYPHPWLGVEGLGYEISPALAEVLELPVERGLLVAQIYRNSPADQAGLRAARNEAIIGNRRFLVGGDIITAIDDQPMSTWEDVNAYLEEQTQVGQSVTLTIMRDGREMTLTATLQDTPEQLRGT